MTRLPTPDDGLDRARRAALGRRVRSLRLARGTTSAEFAARLGRSSAWMSAVENGRHDVGIEELWAIAEELEVRLAELVAEIDQSYDA